MIKTILSDIGNVLIFLNQPEAGLNIYGYNHFKKYQIRSKIKEYEKGKLSTTEFFNWLGSRLNPSFGMSSLDEMFEKLFSLNGKMVLVMEKLKKKYRTIVVSNTNEAHYNFLRKKYDILDIFDDHVLSYEVGSLKPEKKIYKIALKKARCRPEECIFIDDRKSCVKAAKKLGINAIQYSYKSHSDLEKKLIEFGVL